VSLVLRMGSSCEQKCQKGPTIKFIVRIKIVRFIYHTEEILSSKNACKLKFIFIGRLNKWSRPVLLDMWG